MTFRVEMSTARAMGAQVVSFARRVDSIVFLIDNEFLMNFT